MPDYAFGCLPGRAREEAIMGQFIAGCRLKQYGVSSVLMLLDMANAFPSVGSEAVMDVAAGLRDAKARVWVEDHMTNGVCILDAYDGAVTFAPGSGVMPGTSIATQVFNAVQWRNVVEPWKSAAWELDEVCRMQSVLPGEDIAVDISMTVFVGDVAKRVAGVDEAQIVEQVQRATMVLDEVASVVQLKQNHDKRENVATLCGRGSAAMARRWRRAQMQVGEAPISLMKMAARYLGARLCYDFSYTIERKHRTDAAARAYYRLKGLWGQVMPFAYKRMVFVAVCLSTLVSAVTAFMLNKTDYKVLAGHLQKYARKILGGRACEKIQVEEGTGFVKYESHTDLCFLQQLQMAPVHIEIAIRRLKFYASMLDPPEHHRYFWTVLFGEFALVGWEEHPWAVEMAADLELLRYVESVQWEVEVL